MLNRPLTEAMDDVLYKPGSFLIGVCLPDACERGVELRLRPLFNGNVPCEVTDVIGSHRQIVRIV